MNEHGEATATGTRDGDGSASRSNRPAGASQQRRSRSGGSKPAASINPRLLMVAAGAVLVVIVLIVLAVSVLRRDRATTEQEVESSIVTALVEMEQEAQTAGTRVLDMTLLRARLDQISGFVVSMNNTPEGGDVGVAARQIEGPACVFVWTSPGGPRTATVQDPNLPCVAAIALEAAAAS